MLKLPVPPIEEGWFRWLLEPDARAELSSCKWFTDGSLLNPEAGHFVSCGYAVVVLSPLGTLLGVGIGKPPWWVRTSGGAEAWALRFVVSNNITVPPTYTDCLSLLHTADAGPAAATAASRPLARVWVDINHATEGNF